MPAPPAVICDVGGAAGIYAFPLSEKGYHVHLIDPARLHLQQAQAYAEKSGIGLASIARHIEMSDAVIDVVLLLGHLYHLVQRSERDKALSEARRILKAGGLLIAAGISRYASLIDGVTTGALADARFRQIVIEDLSSGQHRNPTTSPEYFTSAYFHRPDELRAEIDAAGFREIKLLGIEGPAWGAAHFRSAVADDAQREALLAMLSKIEQEPSLVGASAHFIALARK